MKYKIKTDDAQEVINRILSCIGEKVDVDGRNISTWELKTVLKKTKNGLKLIQFIVHNPEQWDKKGGIKLKADITNKFILVTFHYWNSFPIGERVGDEEKYILGRCTELLLVHFENIIESITIDLD